MHQIDVTKEAFNSKQACVLVGLSPRRVDYWDRQDLVKPSMASAMGRGSRRLYSYTDLLALMTVRSLREQGVSLQKVGKCVRYLRGHLPDVSHPLTYCHLVVAGESVFLVEDEQTLLDTVRRPGQRASVHLSIDAMDRELRGKVVRLSARRTVDVAVGEETYQVVVEPDEECGGYTATVAGLRGCITQGDTLEEVLDNASDAIKCWLGAQKDMARRGIRVPVRRSARKKASA
ncbi:MAG TPA: MerR family transcriptional regulator [Phycisphaerae bacterium]|nr:MerR family transcriptional regulator [Phycisphaerae bacterium]